MEATNGNGKRPSSGDILEGEGVIVHFDTSRFRRSVDGAYLRDRQGNRKLGQYGFIHRNVECDPMNCQDSAHEVYFTSEPVFKAIYHGNFFKLDIGTRVKFKAGLPRHSDMRPVAFWLRVCEERSQRRERPSSMPDPITTHGR